MHLYQSPKQCWWEETSLQHLARCCSGTGTSQECQESIPGHPLSGPLNFLPSPSEQFLNSHLLNIQCSKKMKANSAHSELHLPVRTLIIFWGEGSAQGAQGLSSKPWLTRLEDYILRSAMQCYPGPQYWSGNQSNPRVMWKPPSVHWGLWGWGGGLGIIQTQISEHTKYVPKTTELFPSTKETYNS